MATLHGRAAKITLGASPIGEAREWTINVTRNMDEDEAFGDSWRTQLPGIKEWSGTMEFNYDPAVTALHAAALGDVVVALEFFPVASGTAKYSGNAWADFDLTAGVGGTMRGTMTFTGEGALAYAAS